jgi:hypothetical protein
MTTKWRRQIHADEAAIVVKHHGARFVGVETSNGDHFRIELERYGKGRFVIASQSTSKPWVAIRLIRRDVRHALKSMEAA